MEEDSHSLTKPMMSSFEIEDHSLTGVQLKLSFRRKKFLSVRDLMVEACP
jgi:hypothetical protein